MNHTILFLGPQSIFFLNNARNRHPKNNVKLNESWKRDRVKDGINRLVRNMWFRYICWWEMNIRSSWKAVAMKILRNYSTSARRALFDPVSLSCSGSTRIQHFFPGHLVVSRTLKLTNPFIHGSSLSRSVNYIPFPIHFRRDYKLLW